MARVTKPVYRKSSQKLASELVELIKPIPGKSPKFEPNKDGIRYWLVKSEPLKRIDSKTGKDVSYPMSQLLKVEKELWDGV